jgi:hypothetical protein
MNNRQLQSAALVLGLFGVANGGCSSGLPADDGTGGAGGSTGGRASGGATVASATGGSNSAGGNVTTGGAKSTGGKGATAGATSVGGVGNVGAGAAGKTDGFAGASSAGRSPVAGATSAAGASGQASSTGGSSASGCSALNGAVYFCDDFESNLSKWEVATNGWTTIDTTYQSPGHSATDSPNGNYPQGADNAIGMATSVDLGSATSPVLVFWQKLDLTNSAYSSCYNDTNAVHCNATGGDHGYVEISTDSGTTWSQLVDMYCTNNTSTWSRQQFSLVPYLKQKIKLRFRLWDRSIDTCQGDGWYIDDVVIREPA